MDSFSADSFLLAQTHTVSVSFSEIFTYGCLIAFHGVCGCLFFSDGLSDALLHYMCKTDKILLVLL